MKIAIATLGRFYVLDLARELRRLGHDVVFYSALPGSRLEAYGVPAACGRRLTAALPWLVVRRLFRSPSTRAWAGLRMSEAVDRRVAERVEPCEVFIGMSGLYLEAGKAARAKHGARFLLERGSRHILSQRALVGPEGRWDAAVDARELAGYEAADVIVVPSRHAEASFLERGIPAGKLFRNPYGVDLEAFPPTPAPPADPPVVLFVGEWCRRKGADLLATAISRMACVRLVHVGPVGDVPFPRLACFTHHEPVEQKKLVRFYREAHVLALPSREDGFGLVLAQALACGLPVVASAFTGGPDLREFFPEPGLVTVASSCEVEPLSAALSAALARAATRTGLRNPPEGVLEKLSWKAYGERYDRFLASLPGPGGGAMSFHGQTMAYAGSLREGETSLQRLRAYESLGIKVIPVDMLFGAVSFPRRLAYRTANALFRRGWPVRLPDLAGVNRALERVAEDNPLDWVWLDKALMVRPETLVRLRKVRPGVRIAEFAPDDVGARHNQSRQFLECLPLLDAFVTTKSFNVPELKALGCPRVVFMDNGYDPETHRPVPVTPELKSRVGGGVGFIGSYEENRARSLLALARSGIPVRVWGGTSWRRCRLEHPNLRFEYKELVGQDYAPAICAFDINLCFLRKLNRDLQTTRSVEIPACGAFMLAERSEEHRRLFEEDREAVYFGEDRELVEKCRYYLEHVEERERIAKAGRFRCEEGGYAYPGRLSGVLTRIMESRTDG